MVLLAKLDAAFPSAGMTQHDRALRYRVFADALQGYSAKAISGAVVDYIQTPSTDHSKKFFPEPPELIELCKEHTRMLIPKPKARPAKPGPL